MDFKKVLKIIISEFDKQDIRYGLIGGFALGVLGISRTTVDLDFLVLKDDLEKVEKIMATVGYNCIYKTENVSQYVSPLKVLGEIDFLHAFRKASRSMLKRMIEKNIFSSEMKINVIAPEDIIGLKLQAMVNDPSREMMDLLDLEKLMAHYQCRLNWELIEEYFELFEMMDKFMELKGKYGDIN